MPAQVPLVAACHRSLPHSICWTAGQRAHNVATCGSVAPWCSETLSVVFCWQCFTLWLVAGWAKTLHSRSEKTVCKSSLQRVFAKALCVEPLRLCMQRAFCESSMQRGFVRTPQTVPNSRRMKFVYLVALYFHVGNK